MASPLAPTPAPPTTSVNGPDATDPRTALSVRAPMTAILGFVIWLYNVLTGVTSQAVTLLSSLTVSGTVQAPLFVATGGMQTPAIYWGLNAVAGPLTTGTYNVPAITQHVYAPSGAALAGGNVWQLSAGAQAGAFCRLVNNSNVAAVTVKDQVGTTLAAIRPTSGGYYAVTCCFIGGTWVVIEQNLWP